jgi:hypothetical protein
VHSSFRTGLSAHAPRVLPWAPWTLSVVAGGGGAAGGATAGGEGGGGGGGPVLTLPLFVMSLLMPGETMALNIFEPRYRLMVRGTAQHAERSTLSTARTIPAHGVRGCLRVGLGRGGAAVLHSAL